MWAIPFMQSCHVNFRREKSLGGGEAFGFYYFCNFQKAGCPQLSWANSFQEMLIVKCNINYFSHLPFNLLWNSKPWKMNTDVMINHEATGWKWRLGLLACIWKVFFNDDNILFVNGLFIGAMCSPKRFVKMITKAYPYVECVCIFVNLAICPENICITLKKWTWICKTLGFGGLFVF